MKRYVQEKIAFIQNSAEEHEHVLVIPGAKNEITSSGRSRIYSVRSPLISKTTQYRALLDLRALDEIIAREQPEIIESADPYQVGWKAIRSGRVHRIPVVAFYHSHFPEAYLRAPARRFGERGSQLIMSAARGYVRNLYNRFAITCVPSERLAQVLRDWGVASARAVDLGVNVETFHPEKIAANSRETLGVPAGRKLLLYVGRLAAEKNTQTLFDAFSLLDRRRPGAFHLHVIGNGQQRELLQRLQRANAAVSWLPYCTDSHELANFYRAADLFVHPGTEETFGLVALESQACATPVLGIRGSYMDDNILHDQTAWATQNSAEALARAVENACAMNLRAMGESGSVRVCERFAWPRVFARLFCIYREVCEAYRQGPTG